MLLLLRLPCAARWEESCAELLLRVRLVGSSAHRPLSLRRPCRGWSRRLRNEYFARLLRRG